MSPSKIFPAVIEWNDDGTPASKEFNDIYFSRAGGTEETRYVFIQQNKLAEKIKTLKPGEQFTIAETGFGTGLNFLCVWQLWNELAPKNAQLNFFSVDLFPLTQADLTKALAIWPEFSDLAQPLIRQYPDLVHGYHRLAFQQVNLTLAFGDASWAFKEFYGKVDAFFLDGFAPSKNPGMWTAELFSSIARISKHNTSFATFTAAGLVRNGLKGVGFKVEKCAGFGKKRDMLRGQFQGICPPKPEQRANWFTYPSINQSSQKSIAIVGAGIAGSFTARALKKRGFKVEVFEKESSPAQGASGNAQGALYIKLASDLTHHCRFYSQAFIHASKDFDTLKSSGAEWHQCGVIQAAWDDKELARQQQINAKGNFPETLVKQVSGTDVAHLSGIDLDVPGHYFPSGGWANPPSLCQAALEGIDVNFSTDILSIEHSDNQWNLHFHSGESKAFDAVVITAAWASKKFSQLKPLPIKKIRGQVSYQSLQSTAPNLKTVLCSHVYVAPPWKNQLVFGATFNLNEDEEGLRLEDHQENCDQLIQSFPYLNKYIDETQLNGRVGFRCTSPDYTPIVGPVPDWDYYQQNYQGWGQKKHALWPVGKTFTNLYCNLAHGSRGLASAPLSAELIAAMINNEPLPVPKDIADHLHPARFLIRSLKKSPSN